ncbi:MAG: efflux RND transporter periplasmic adaptor subunit [Planctomycetota bacterium]|jgi:multidrug efflux pump subunit AcrA (membrane-fusion protein)
MKNGKGIVRRWLPAFLLMAFIGGIHGIAIRANARMKAEARKKEEAEKAAKAEGKPKVIWTCSMDPQIRWDHPGLCPICSMDLIPVSGEAGIGIKLEPRYLQLAGVRTAPVIHRELHREVRTVGIFEADETKRKTVSAWIGGRLERLFVDHTGQEVRAGAPVALIYSPELIRSRDEFLLAKAEALRAGRENPEEGEKARVKAALDAARSRLLRFGLSEEQIREMESGKNLSPHLKVLAPLGGTVLHKNVQEGDTVPRGHVLYHIADLSTLWLILDVYENELPALRVGQNVIFEPGAYPGERIRGFVTFIDPTVDTKRRTIRVRVPVDNREGRFRPGMFVKARIRVDLGPSGEVLTPTLGGYACPRHPEVIADEPGTCPLGGAALAARPEIPLPAGFHACEMECGHYDQPGPCPVCGMKMLALEPGVETRPAYVCLLHPEERGAEPGPCAIDGKKKVRHTRRVGRALAVPREGLLTIGTRHFVFERVETGKFEPREILVGPLTKRFAPLRILPQLGTIYPHLQTVRRGDAIVVAGAYFLDSQLQLQGKLSVFAPTLPALQALAPTEIFLNEYFLASRGLSEDRLGTFGARHGRMVSALKEVLQAGFPPQAHGAEPTRKLQEHVRHMAPALEAAPPDTLAGARKIIAGLGEGMRMLVEQVHRGIYGAGEIHLFRDPVSGSIWAQREEEPANPFRGKAGKDMAERIGEPREKGQGKGEPTGGGAAHAHHH